jgi:hypothetical protein
LLADLEFSVDLILTFGLGWLTHCYLCWLTDWLTMFKECLLCHNTIRMQMWAWVHSRVMLFITLMNLAPFQAREALLPWDASPSNLLSNLLVMLFTNKPMKTEQMDIHWYCNDFKQTHSITIHLATKIPIRGIPSISNGSHFTFNR